MPDNESMNIFMAILERIGVVRKVETEEDAEFSKLLELKKKTTQAKTATMRARLQAEQNRMPVGLPSVEEEYGKIEASCYLEGRTMRRLNTDRYQEIEELYSAYSLEPDREDTIYFAEEYSKTIPPELPIEARREIISEAAEERGIEYEGLISDGIQRVRILKEYAEDFRQRTDEYIGACSAELERLDYEMAGLRDAISRRRELYNTQFESIEKEARRLRDILSYLSEI